MKSKSTKLERDFQPELIKDLKNLFKGCIITKLDSSYIQGIPDLLVLYKDKWATLECKKSKNKLWIDFKFQIGWKSVKSSLNGRQAAADML